MSGMISLAHLQHGDPRLEATFRSISRVLPGSKPEDGENTGRDPGHAPGADGGSTGYPFDPCNYREFLATIPLRHISIHQVVRCHFKKRGEVTNQLPPKELWSNITPTLLLADELAHRLKASLQEITSAYRTPEYNALIQGAAEGSFHTRNQALDLKFDCPVPRVAEMAHQLRQDGLFQGGIGIYPSFLHLDTRGKNVDWDLMPTQKA